jgi:hypothetical protein
MWADCPWGFITSLRKLGFSGRPVLSRRQPLKPVRAQHSCTLTLCNRTGLAAPTACPMPLVSAAKPEGVQLRCGRPAHHLTFRRVVSTARPGFRPGVVAEETRSYASWVSRARYARRAPVPTGRAIRRISHHLDSFLRSRWNAADSLHTSTTRLDWISQGRTGRSPSATQRSLDSAQFPSYCRHCRP